MCVTKEWMTYEALQKFDLLLRTLKYSWDTCRGIPHQHNEDKKWGKSWLFKWVFSSSRNAGTSSLKYNQSFGPGSLQRTMKGRMRNGPWTERKERLMVNETTITWNFTISSKLIVGPLRHRTVKRGMMGREIDYFLNQDVAYLNSSLSRSRLNQ